MGNDHYLLALVGQVFLLPKEDFKHTSQKSCAATQTPGMPPSPENIKHKQAISIINATAAVNANFSSNMMVHIYIYTHTVLLQCSQYPGVLPARSRLYWGMSKALEEQKSILHSHFPETHMKKP